MAKGLFTAGDPVADILAKRRMRAQDLQNQMMQLSAQGAARPDKARLASFLGSAIGRGLAGTLPDPELDKIKAEQEGIQGLQKDFAAALTQGKADEQLALANELIQKGYTQEGTQLFQQAQLNKQAEAERAAAAQKKLDEELEESLERESNFQLATSIRKDYPNIADQVEAGNPEAIKTAMKLLTPDKAKGGSGDTAQIKNLAKYEERKLEIEKRVEEDPTFTKADARVELHAIKSALNIAIDPNVDATARQDAKDVSEYLTEVSTSASGSTKRIASYNQTLAMLDAGMYTGVGAEAVQSVRRLAIALGIADRDTEITAANVDQFRANAMDMVLDRIQQTKGAISNAEMQKFAEAGIALSKTPKGNRLILETAKRFALWEKRRASAINAWYGEQRDDGAMPRRDEVKKFASEWERKNQLEMPTGVEYSEAMQESVISSSDLDSMTDDEVIQQALGMIE